MESLVWFCQKSFSSFRKNFNVTNRNVFIVAIEKERKREKKFFFFNLSMPHHDYIPPPPPPNHHINYHYYYFRIAKKNVTSQGTMRENTFPRRQGLNHPYVCRIRMIVGQKRKENSALRHHQTCKKSFPRVVHTK